MGASSSASVVNEDHGIFYGRSSIWVDQDEIIREVMSARRLLPRNIPSGLARRSVRGHGKAECSTCGRVWTSHQASAILNFKEQRVVRVWKQKCQKCRTEVSMTFKSAEFESMINRELVKLQRKMRGEPVDSSFLPDETRGPPHCRELCEGCEYGKGDCRQAKNNGRVQTGYVAVGAWGGDDAGQNTTGVGTGDDAGQSTAGVGTGTAVLLGLVGAAALFGAAFMSDSKKRRP